MYEYKSQINYVKGLRLFQILDISSRTIGDETEPFRSIGYNSKFPGLSRVILLSVLFITFAAVCFCDTK